LIAYEKRGACSMGPRHRRNSENDTDMWLTICATDKSQSDLLPSYGVRWSSSAKTA
jgi:hypothetical protein